MYFDSDDYPELEQVFFILLNHTKY